MRRSILILVFSLALAGCALSKADRPEINVFDISTPTMRLIFPVEGADTETPTPTFRPLFPLEPSDTPTLTPVGFIPSSTPTIHLIFPLETTETPFFCKASPGVNTKIEGVIWLDKNGDGVRDSGENGIEGVRVDVAHSRSSVRTDRDGKYALPIPAGAWPVLVQLPNDLYTFDVFTQDSRIAYVSDQGGALCSGSSYNVGLVPLPRNAQPAKTKEANDDDQPGGGPPTCSQEPNNPNCTP